MHLCFYLFMFGFFLFFMRASLTFWYISEEQRGVGEEIMRIFLSFCHGLGSVQYLDKLSDVFEVLPIIVTLLLGVVAMQIAVIIRNRLDIVGRASAVNCMETLLMVELLLKDHDR